MTSSDTNDEHISGNEAFVTIFSSSNHDAEMEALTIEGILKANDIPVLLNGPHTLPVLDFQVQVPEHVVDRALDIISEARRAGPCAAEEAEAESEKLIG
jgi:hypothetical protein